MNQIFVGDCVKSMREMGGGIFNLTFADPPYNIGYEYDEYEDTKTDEEYVNWCGEWGREVYRTLKEDGTFWLAIGDTYASDLDVLFRRTIGFHRRSWVVWFFTFGINCVRKLTPSHVHLFQYVKSDTFTFNGEAIKVPSARQAVYNDKRAKKGGRLPDDTWILRPKEHPDLFQPDSSVWNISRVCGTFKERVKFPCQLPEKLLERVIILSSNPGELVFDPFLGSGTTAVVADRLSRKWAGCELSENYAQIARERICKGSSQRTLMPSTA